MSIQWTGFYRDCKGNLRRRRLEPFWRVVEWLGARGVNLVLWGVFMIIRGVLVWSEEAWDDDSFVFFQYIPMPVRTFLWCSFGLFAIFAAFRRDREFWQKWGFALLVAMPLERFAGHFVSWVMHLVPGAPEGDRFGIVWAAMWMVIVLKIVADAQADEDIERRSPGD